MPIIIPYLASKFTQDQFKRMQINLFASIERMATDIKFEKIKKFKNIHPKYVQINTK